MKKYILVIGKDQMIRERIQMALCDENIIVHFANSQVSYQEFLKDSRYCLVIWDMQLEICFRSYHTKRLEKPVDMEICAEQVRSILRQEQGYTKLHSMLTFGTELVIDRQYHSVEIDGIQIPLTPIEFALLLYLAQSPGQVFNNEQLYVHVWGDVPDSKMEKTVKVHLSNLRKKLAAFGKAYIQNIRGVGYKFIPPPVEEN